MNEFQIDFYQIFRSIFHLSKQSNHTFSNQIEQTKEHRMDTQRVHLPAIELKHLILPFEQTDIEHSSTHHYVSQLSPEN